MPLFADRREAGHILAERLGAEPLHDPLVLALPRGGVPVAFMVAMALDAPLDLMLVRKLGAPNQPEHGIGAVTFGDPPRTVMNLAVMDILRPSPSYVAEETARQVEELHRRRRLYVGDRPPPDVANRSIVLVDDGIATGGTAQVALEALREGGAKPLLLAVPVAPSSVLDAMTASADRIICLASPAPFRSVGEHYADFSQTSDDEVIALLKAAANFGMHNGDENGRTG